MLVNLGKATAQTASAPTGRRARSIHTARGTPAMSNWRRSGHRAAGCCRPRRGRGGRSAHGGSSPRSGAGEIEAGCALAGPGVRLKRTKPHGWQGMSRPTKRSAGARSSHVPAAGGGARVGKAAGRCANPPAPRAAAPATAPSALIRGTPSPKAGATRRSTPPAPGRPPARPGHRLRSAQRRAAWGRRPARRRSE